MTVISYITLTVDSTKQIVKIRSEFPAEGWKSDPKIAGKLGHLKPDVPQRAPSFIHMTYQSQLHKVKWQKLSAQCGYIGHRCCWGCGEHVRGEGGKRASGKACDWLKAQRYLRRETFVPTWCRRPPPRLLVALLRHRRHFGAEKKTSCSFGCLARSG